MGLMQGKVIGNSIVIMDSFALPVQGTETRVNAANEANEYMVTYIEEGEKVRLDDMLQQSCETDFCAPRSLVRVGQTTGESDRMVSFPSGLWVLVVWYRRRHANEQSAIPRSFRGRRRASGVVLFSNLYLIPVSRFSLRCIPHRSTPTARFQRERSTLVLSALTPKTIPLERLLHLNTNPSPSPRSKISVPTPINIINSKSKSSNPVWTRSCSGCCGTNTGSIR